jgi:hypothetical protein
MNNFESASPLCPPIFPFVDLVGDYAAQVQWGRRHWLDFDLSRTLRNGAIGAMFGPLVSVRCSDFL